MRVEGSGAGGDDWFSDMRNNSLHGTAIGQERGGEVSDSMNEGEI